MDSLVVGHVLTGGELTALQRRAARHLAFSLTRACPLRCAHCIVHTVLPRGAKQVTIPLDRADAYARELGALRERGVERISFTGGEPFLAVRQLELLSLAAVEAGIACSVVTACHWARTERGAAGVVDRFRHIDRWHVSTDRYHEEFIPASQVVAAARLLAEAGAEVLVRVAVPIPPDNEDVELCRRLAADLPMNIELSLQSVAKVGRAEDLDIEVRVGDGPRHPCLSTGPVVRDDGTVSPCCSALIDWHGEHPFRFAPASEVGVVSSHEAWMQHPLLQLIRAVGFAPVLRWVAEEMPEHPLLSAVPAHPCDVCIGLWRHRGTAAVVERQLERPNVREKIAEAYAAVFPQSAVEPVGSAAT